jgi:glucosamine--fructose-6-phosphate aminotransferase (isomerizing)
LFAAARRHTLKMEENRMTSPQSHMLSEAQDAPNRVRELLASEPERFADLGRRLRDLDPAVVGTVARGSSDHAARYAAYLIPQCTGKVVASIPPSVVTILNARLRLKGQFVLSLSQSGGSPDLNATQARAREGGALTAALVNVADSPLARSAEVFLDQKAGPEKSITATKSVLCTLAGIARLTAEWSQDAALLRALALLPDALHEAAASGTGYDANILHGVKHAFILSRGLGYGAATEVALKLKETCGVHAEAFSTAEVRHGPREIVNKDYLIIALALPGSGAADVLSAANEMKAQGARTLIVGQPGTGQSFALPKLPDDRLAPLAALQVLYPWIARAAQALGRDPDKPKTLLSKVIKTT